MKKLLTKLMGITLGLAMVVGAGAAIANSNVKPVYADDELSYSITLTGSQSEGTNLTTGSLANITGDGVSTYISSLATCTKTYGPTSDGVKIGASSNAGTFKFNLKDAGKVTATKFVVNAKLYNSSKAATLNVNSIGAQSVSADFSNLTFTPTTASDITFINLVSSKYIWVKSVSVYVAGANQNEPTITLSTSSVEGFTGEEFSVTATYSNLTSDFAWGDPTGEGSISGSVTNTTGNGTDGTSTYSGTLTGHGAVSLTATGGGATAATISFDITQTTLNIVKSSTSIPQGEKETLAIEHSASSVDGVTWTSDNEKVSVSETGVVTVAADAAIGSTATITVVSKVDANASDTCAVTVTKAPNKYTITGPSKTQSSGSTPTLSQLKTWYPIADDAYVEWTAVSGKIYGSASSAMRFGTGTATDTGSMTLSIKEGAPIYFTKVIVNAKTWSSETGNTLKVNDETVDVTADWDDYDFEIANDVTDIVLGNGYKRVNIYSVKVLYEFKTPEITVNNASYEIYTNETASAEVALANFLETPTLESNVTGDTTSISSVAIGAIANNKATVTITPNKVAGTAVVRIRDAANPDTYYVDIQVTVKSVEELIEAKVSRSSLYYKYSKDGNDQFHFSSIKLRLGGFISEALWTDLNAESEIQGFGAILAKADNLSEDIKTFVDTFDNANVRNVYHPLTEKMPADADEYQKTQQGVNVDDNYYVWNLVTNISDENVNNLTERYTCVAYIKTASGVVFMQETTKSVADVARDVVQSNEELYNDEYLEGSLRYLASL